jgi:hypothetical protein
MAAAGKDEAMGKWSGVFGSGLIAAASMAALICLAVAGEATAGPQSVRWLSAPLHRYDDVF